MSYRRAVLLMTIRLTSSACLAQTSQPAPSPVVISDPEPGFQIYWMIVDGTRIIDPGTKPVYVNGDVGAVDVSGPNDDYYQAQRVPHGDVREHWFYPEITQE